MVVFGGANGYIAEVLSDYHEQGACAYEEAAYEGLGGEFLVKENEGQDEGKDDAQFVYGDHFGGFPCLEGFIVAEP